MVTNSKVLTVSYGTFSCTLEGFDDSFDTMKAIAEYFRDLAGDDRYFGAEPPTPDAEMLARIAEREIERRVQARTEHGAIVLTAPAAQADAEIAPEPEAPQAAPDVASEPTAVSEEIVPDVESATSADDDTHDTGTDAGDSVVPQDAVSEDVSDEEVLEKQEIQDTQEIEIVDVSDTPEISNILASLSDTDDNDDQLALDDSVDDAAEEIIEAEIMEAPEAETVSDLAPAIDHDDDSIAAKLRRIRAVVSKADAQPEEDDFSEDEHAENLMTPDVDDSESVLQLDDAMATAAVETDVRVQDSEAQTEVSEAQDNDDTPKTVTPVRPVRARVVRMKREDFEDAVTSGVLEAEEDPTDSADAAQDVIEAEVAPVSGDAARASESTLTPEDEADLVAELAQIEAELNRADALGDDAEIEEDAAQDVAPVTEPSQDAVIAEDVAAADVDVSRLMAETDNQMDEPEGSRRRSAIAHLRAAVAATKAEKAAGQELRDTTDGSEAYRDDLASVVQPLQGARPKRPQVPNSEAEQGSAPRPSREDGPAPLKLVAEQRVDAPTQEADTTQRDPVRPRRVSAADRTEAPVTPAAPVSAPEEKASNFAEYAENMGANNLPDMLEAAASYLTFVEGHDRFSRPMLMRMARDMDEDNFTREDGLRGFGQLLRQNKIEKLPDGRFTASERISFKPEDRAAG